MATRACAMCGETKSLDEFARNKSLLSGFANRCKVCHRAAVAASRKRHPVAHAVSARRWRAENQTTNRERMAARSLVARAIKRGDLAKPDTCDECSAQGRIEAHHEDYAKPLEVEWLCPVCHRTRHPRAVVA